jgi:hypothetical protein
VTDDLRSRFDDLRARTIPEVQPPGESAVRRTVRRRRAIRSGAAAVALGALAGFLIWPFGGSGDGLTLAERETRAAMAVGLDPAQSDPLGGHGPAVPGYAVPFVLHPARTPSACPASAPARSPSRSPSAIRQPVS